MKPIICGFAGIGKSTLARRCPGVIDLESTPFNKNWDMYINVALHMQKQGYLVLVSCHEELRKELAKREVDYVVAVPVSEEREEYVRRYKYRGNTEGFINLLYSNFNDWISDIWSTEDSKKIWTIEKYLEDSLKERGVI